MASFPAGISAITLFVDNLALAQAFYVEVFGLPVHYEDDVSAVFDFGTTLINLLQSSEAVGLIAPILPGPGPAVQFTVTVDDVDATIALLSKRGVALINGPMDRPWGIRTACFADPAGHIWEIAT